VKGFVAFAEDNFTGPKGPHLHSPEDCLSLGVRHAAKDTQLRMIEPTESKSVSGED
jgi:hypothetical protein